MPATIRVLDDLTINKIAAGEVIENTASVVKELVENSIDANSKEITVEITSGGRQLIRVTDNGCGMNPDDALLCLERHATSKLSEIQHIHELLTMGFRGEAIPSIASISQFMLLTSKDEKGTLIRVEGGKVKECAPAMRSQGTTIEVKSLFFNVPVRKKFQRSPTYDANEIHKILVKLSLANPNICFHLINNGTKVFSTPKITEDRFLDVLASRIRHTLGQDFFEELFPVENEQIQGYIGYPYNTRPNRSEQYLFVNKRVVISNTISYAIKEGYGTALPSGRHPIYILHLQLPTDFVDVNVHPQKREVRLQEELKLKEKIAKAIQQAITTPQNDTPLQSKTFIPSFQFEPNTFPKIRIEEENELIPSPSFAFEQPATYTPLPKVLETLSHFILVKTPENTLALIDQKSATTRIFFEKIKKNCENIESQTLLIPRSFDVSTLESAIIKENLSLFCSIGLEIQELGKNTFVIHSIPTFIGEEKIESLIVEMAHDFQNQVETEKKLRLAKQAARFSSHRELSLYEAELLIKELMRCEISDHCPFGNKTMLTITEDMLKTLFSKK